DVLMERQLGQFPHVRVEGGPRIRGRQYGEQVRDRVRLSIDAYRQVFGHYAGWDWSVVRQQALAFEHPISSYEPSYLEEMHGIAEGAAVPFEDILAVNVRSEIMFSAKARSALTHKSKSAG